MDEAQGHNFTIKYEYDSWSACGWDCCHDSSSEIHIYDNRRLDGAYLSSFNCQIIEDEDELRDFIHKMDPYYDGFTVHEDTRYF